MDELISKKAAIDALDQIFDRCEEIEAHLPEGDPDRTGYKMYPDYMTVWKYLHQLPSAPPEIIRCRECKFASGDSRICMQFGHSPIGELDFCSFAERREVTTEPDTDTISRAKAIEALTKDKKALEHIINGMSGYEKEFDCFVGQRNQVDSDIYAIKQLPPIQPKKGRWIYCEDSTADCVDGYRCDQCGFFVPWDYQHKGIDFIQDYNFCPKCGAKMEGASE